MDNLFPRGVRLLHLAAFGSGHGTHVADLVGGHRRDVTTQNSLSLVAIYSDRIVGHVPLTSSLLDAPRRLVELQVLSPISVIPEGQGAGVGSALIKRGLDVLAERAVPLVFLEGSPTYYSRFGFKAGAELGFRKPSLRIPDAAVQAVLLPAYQAWMTGTLVYSEVYWQHEGNPVDKLLPRKRRPGAGGRIVAMKGMRATGRSGERQGESVTGISGLIVGDEHAERVAVEFRVNPLWLALVMGAFQTHAFP